MLVLWRRHHVIQTHIHFGRQADSRRERVKVSPRVIGYLFCSIRNITVERRPSAESGLDFKPFPSFSKPSVYFDLPTACPVIPDRLVTGSRDQ